MAQTHRTGSMRRALRREAPSTVGLLADEQDFAAMRRYRTFTFDDHAAYLQQVEGLLRSLTAEEVHTTVALFDPEEYEEFCTAAGLDPDSAESRTRFTAGIAADGATVPYTGQPIDRLVPLLVNAAVCRATLEYATLVLADAGECADCGRNVGTASFDRASRALKSLLDGAGAGVHHLVCSIPTEDEPLIAVLHAESGEDPGIRLDRTEGTAFVTVLAAGMALESPGGTVVRTTAPGQDDRVRGWRLQRGRLLPLTAGEVFSAYCTDADTGDPVPPEPGVDYCAGYPIPDDGAHH
ncbi:hypothetical protein [Streptomyces sp. NPDC059398]|uniref:hypothetical protein n=1 Tax=Streptomyces sp. NPDC059398 TaxID=3346820 RepID=UPI0036822BAC